MAQKEKKKSEVMVVLSRERTWANAQGFPCFMGKDGTWKCPRVPQTSWRRMAETRAWRLACGWLPWHEPKWLWCKGTAKIASFGTGWLGFLKMGWEDNKALKCPREQFTYSYCTSEHSAVSLGVKKPLRSWGLGGPRHAETTLGVPGLPSISAEARDPLVAPSPHSQ